MDAQVADSDFPKVAPVTPRARRWLYLLIFPIGFLFLHNAFVPARGPFYVRPNLDPDYAYLFNSLNVATRRSPQHIDHPGTTVQVLGGLVIKISHLSSHRRQLAEKVLREPERHLQLINYTIAGIYFACILVGGVMVWRQTGKLFPALLLQSTPFLLGFHAPAVARVCPEPLLLVFGMLLATALYLNSIRMTTDIRMVIILGLLSASAIITKLTFLPLAAVPFFCFETSKQRGLYMIAGAVFTLLWLLPVVTQIGQIASWVVALATHQEHYGTGEAGAIPKNYASNVLRMIMEYPGLFSVLGVSWLAVLSRSGLREEKARRQFRLLFALALCETAQVLIATKYARHRYLIPTIAFCPLNLVLVLNLARQRWGDCQFWRAVPVLGFASACVAVGIVGFQLKNRQQVLTRSTTGRTQLAQAIDEEFGDDTVVLGEVSSSPYYALWFGNMFCGVHYTALLRDKILPPKPYYVFRSDGYIWLNGAKVMPFSQFALEHDSFVVQCVTEDAARIAGSIPPQARIQKVLQTSGPEAIYRVSSEATRRSY